MAQKAWNARNSTQAQDKCLRDAVRCENPSLVSLVLEEGNKISAKEAQKHLWASIAVLKDANILRMLLDIGAEAQELHLSVAAQMGDAEMVGILIENGVKAFSRSMINAVKANHLGVLEELLEAGGDPATRGSCCINIAVRKGLIDVVQMLLKYGEDPNNVRTNVIALANSIALRNPVYGEILNMLKEAGYTSKANN